MFFLSWLTALGSGTASLCLITLTDSPERENRKKLFKTTNADKKEKHVWRDQRLLESLPVRMDWSTRRVVDLMLTILMSAGTLSPTVGITEKPS